MLRQLVFLFLLSCTAFATPSLALECANAPGGSAGTLPDDTGDAFATACGSSAVAGGQFSTALGVGAMSVGNSSIAIGNSAAAGGSVSVAMGFTATALGNWGIAIGDAASAGFSASIAIGREASAELLNGTAVGAFATASNANSTAIGSRAVAAQDNSIVLGSIPGVNGAFDYADVAIGTTTPLTPLHLFRDDGSAQVLVEEKSASAVPRTLFRLASSGSNAKFEIDNTSAGVNWAFTNSGQDFRISRQGSGIVEFRVDNAGNAFLAGDLDIGGDVMTNLLMPSDRNGKRDVEPVDAEAILAQVAALDVSRWSYSDSPGVQHVGPMAQDFHDAFGLGADETAISVVDASGVALAAIQALAEDNRDLQAHNRSLEQRVAELERLVSRLVPNH